MLLNRSTSGFHALRWLLASAVLLVLSTGLAMAQTFGTAASGLTGMMGSIADAALGFMFLAGIVFGGMGAMAVHAHGKDPNQNPLKKAFLFFLASALMIGLPAAIYMTQNSLSLGGQHISASGGQSLIN